MINPISFLHRLNDGGLLFLNHYLENRCNCNVFHISPSGRLIYDGELHDYCQKLKTRIRSRRANKNDTLYDSDSKTLSYQFTINESRQYLVFFPVEEEQCSLIYEEISNIIMPLSYYLKGLYYSFSNYKKLLLNDSKKIFQPHNDYWCSVLRSQQINPMQPVRTVVIDPGEHIDKLDKIQRVVINLFLHDGDADILLYIYRHRIVLILPSRYQIQITEESNPTSPFSFPLYKHHALLEEQFGSGFKISVGRQVPIQDVYISFMQAFSALFYLQYFRKTDSLVQFKKIGPAIQMMQLNFNEFGNELNEKYQFLNKYENDRSGYLFTTLRELVRSQFNYQEVAIRMHIHLNTLYYRQDKLSQLLAMDLTLLEPKIILYEEMFLYDFLHYYNNLN